MSGCEGTHCCQHCNACILYCTYTVSLVVSHMLCNLQQQLLEFCVCTQLAHNLHMQLLKLQTMQEAAADCCYTSGVPMLAAHTG